jgi:hypothetical protein
LDVLAQVRPEQAAAILIRAGFDLPSDLAAIAQTIAVGKSPSQTSDPRADAAEPPADAAEPPADAADPLTATLELIPRSTHAQNLIKFLHGKASRTAKISEICMQIYKNLDKESLAKTRLLIKRTRVKLDRDNAPLRIVVDTKGRNAKIIDR